jgi:hypothetical protein
MFRFEPSADKERCNQSLRGFHIIFAKKRNMNGKKHGKRGKATLGKPGPQTGATK